MKCTTSRGYPSSSSTCFCLVTKAYPILWDPMDCNLPGSSVHGISQARILVWVTISFSRGSACPRDQIHISCTGRGILYCWATREASLSVWTPSKALYLILYPKLFCSFSLKKWPKIAEALQPQNMNPTLGLGIKYESLSYIKCRGREVPFCGRPKLNH